MFDQAPINGSRPPAGETAARAVARNTGEFLHDLVILAELQIRLLLIDGQQSINGMLGLVIMLGAGIAVACATVPVLLIALALLLTEVAKFTPAQAAGTAAAVGFLVAGLLVICGWMGLRKAPKNAFERSEKEWKQNLRWIKDALQKSGSDPARRNGSRHAEYVNH
jgi:hypothetical protein